ncbi:hypothetical protein D3C87_1895840 [compost metagenome]
MDLQGGALGLHRKVANLIGDHGEPSSLLTGSCSLNRSVEGKKIRLFGDGSNGAQDLVDVFTVGGEGLNRL